MILPEILDFLFEFGRNGPGLVAFFLATLALVYARREYKSKNYPIFTFLFTIFRRSSDTVLHLTIENHAEHPIHVSINEIKITSKESDIFPKFEKELSLPIKGKRAFFIHQFEGQFIERVQNDEPNVTLFLKAKSQSVLDKTKELKWTLQTEMKFLLDGTIQTKNIVDRLKVGSTFDTLIQMGRKLRKN